MSTTSHPKLIRTEDASNLDRMTLRIGQTFLKSLGDFGFRLDGEGLPIEVPPTDFLENFRRNTFPVSNDGKTILVDRMEEFARNLSISKALSLEFLLKGMLLSHEIDILELSPHSDPVFRERYAFSSHFGIEAPSWPWLEARLTHHKISRWDQLGMGDMGSCRSLLSRIDHSVLSREERRFLQKALEHCGRLRNTLVHSFSILSFSELELRDLFIPSCNLLLKSFRIRNPNFDPLKEKTASIRIQIA